MHSLDSDENFSSVVAAAADLCMKPWHHAVVDQTLEQDMDLSGEDFLDLTLRIECRDQHGDRRPENDLELEIYKSGSDVNITLSWLNRSKDPILWQGNHPIWMDCESGVRCDVPADGEAIEALARRLRAIFSLDDSNYQG